MTTPVYLGSARLTGTVFLDSPRPLPDHPTAIVFDAIIKTEESELNHRLVMGMFVYDSNGEYSDFRTGLHDISATVRFFPRLAFPVQAHRYILTKPTAGRRIQIAHIGRKPDIRRFSILRYGRNPRGTFTLTATTQHY